MYDDWFMGRLYVSSLLTRLRALSIAGTASDVFVQLMCCQWQMLLLNAVF